MKLDKFEQKRIITKHITPENQTTNLYWHFAEDKINDHSSVIVL